MRRAITAASLFLASDAFAGGIGILATGGVHNETVYFYSKVDEDGNEFASIDDYDQFQVKQMLPTIGSGLSLALGNRDNRIIGDCRFYWIMDSPQHDPAQDTTLVTNPSENVVAAYREQSRHLGLGMVGLSWGIVGSPQNFQLGAVGHIGAAFLTADHTEFLAFDLGPGVTWRLNRQVQLFGDVAYQARLRKELTHSVNAVVGARYMFD